MEEIKQSERQLILNNYKNFKTEDFNYWHNKLTKRIDFLTPLLIELDNKKMNLLCVCKSLAQEVFEVNELIKFLESFDEDRF